MAGTMMGIPSAEIKAAEADYGTKNATLYINEDTDQVVKVNESQQGQKTTVLYSNFNVTNLPAEPQAQLTFNQYLQSENTLGIFLL
jgi:hypothetical protein